MHAMVSRCGIFTAGLEVAVNLLQPIADKFKDVSYADLYQMASVTAIEVSTAICTACCGLLHICRFPRGCLA